MRAKIPFFHLKICFFKLNINTYFESDRLAALVYRHVHNQHYIIIYQHISSSTSINLLFRGSKPYLVFHCENDILCNLLYWLNKWMNREREGLYLYSKMFHWEPEGCYHRRLCTAIAPVWFSMEHLWILIVPFWLSTYAIYIAFSYTS